MNLSLYTVQSIIILDSQGQRVFARYFSPPHNAYPNFQPYVTAQAQKAFEKGLFEKTKKQNSDVILYDGKIVCFKASVDLMIYAIGGGEENELMIYAACMAVREAMEMILRVSVDKRTILEHYDVLSLVIDEICDDGIVLETDPVTISTRVSKAPASDSAMPLDFSEKGLMNAWGMAKEKLADRILKGGL